jgi:hypothetical protein
MGHKPLPKPYWLLLPLAPNYIKASLNHFLKVGMNYYLPESAAKVYANLVNAALKAGIPVSYNDNPLLSASLPADLKVNLKDYNPQTDAMCAMLWDAYKVQVLKELVGEGDGDYINESHEELLEALRERERKYGYKAPLNANLTKPSRWENVPDDEFADPVGYKYPVHTPRNARAALSYFNKPENRRFYTVEGQIKVLTRIIQACLRHGIKVSFQPEDPLYWLLPSTLKRKLAGYDDVEDQDTEEKREEMLQAVAQRAASGVEKATLRVLEWAKEVDEERVVTAIDKVGLKVDREVPVAVTDVPTEVKVEGVGQVPVKEKPVEVDIKVAAQKYDITKVEFLIALPVEKFPADPTDLNELVSRVRDLGLNFNVVKVDGSKGKITFKAEDGSEITLEKQATVGVWQLRGVGTLALWGLQWAINDALKRRFPERNIVVEDLSVDMAVFRDLDTNQLFAVGWKADEVGRIVLSTVVKEVVMTYELPEDAIECYENLKAALWRPDLVSHAGAVEEQVAVAVEVTPSPQP